MMATNHRAKHADFTIRVFCADFQLKTIVTTLPPPAGSSSSERHGLQFLLTRVLRLIPRQCRPAILGEIDAERGGASPKITWLLQHGWCGSGPSSKRNALTRA